MKARRLTGASDLRLPPATSGPAIHVKQSVTYTKEWVRKQRRMTASSNQVLYNVRKSLSCALSHVGFCVQASYQVQGMVGRFVIDVLRPILTGQSLSRFTLEEAVAVVLGGSSETIRQQSLNALWEGTGEPGASGDAQKLRFVLHSLQVGATAGLQRAPIVAPG